MNELLERERPAVLVACPWCDGPVELRPASSEIFCADCRLSLELAPDVPAMRSRTKGAGATRS